MLKRFDLATGTSRGLADVGQRSSGAWGAADLIVFADTGGGLSRIRGSGGDVVSLIKPAPQTALTRPWFLPDGRMFLYLQQGGDMAGIYVGSVTSSQTRFLTPSNTPGRYMSGWLVRVRDGVLMGQRLDLDSLTLSGEPVAIASPVAFDANTLNEAWSVSSIGLLAYRTPESNKRQLGWFDRSGRSLGLLGDPDDSTLAAPRVSPDGRRVAVHRTVGRNTDIWIVDGARMTRLTFDPAFDGFANWSPKGDQVVFESTRGGNVRDLYVKDTSGSAAEKLLYKSDQSKGATDWSANGRFVLFNSADPKTNRDMWALPLSRGGIPFVTLKTPFEERWAQLSPESRWLVYMSNESGRREVYVRAFAEANVAGRHTGGQWQVSNVGGIFPRWAPNGREVYYIGPKGEMMAAAITVAGDDLKVGTPSVLFQTQIVGGGVDNGQGLQFDVARDGRFLINSVVQGPSTPITLVHSWQPARPQ